MKIDLIYPKIPENSDKFHGKCIAFEKYDGTNMHWTWNRDFGWYSFGTRRTQFINNRIGISEFIQQHPELANAPYLFNEWRDRLTIFLCQHEVYRDCSITAFFEFLGPNSFAGSHSEEDAKKDEQYLIMIDLMVNKKLIPPDQLINDFWPAFKVARVVYKGKYSGQFAEDVRKGKYNVNEGVVVKGVVDGEVFMTKVKTKDYLKRLEKR